MTSATAKSRGGIKHNELFDEVLSERIESFGEMEIKSLDLLKDAMLGRALKGEISGEEVIQNAA